MCPPWWLVGVGRMAAVVVVVTFALVVVSLLMILFVQIVGFLLFFNRGSGQTDLWTDPPIEMRGSI